MSRAPYIAVVDLETTGFSPDPAAGGHMPIEFGRCDLGLVGEGWRETEVLDRYSSHLLFPGRAIPPDSSAVHHLIDDDVRAMPHWREEAPHLLALDPAPVAFAAHNAKFERQWLGEFTEPLPWVC